MWHAREQINTCTLGRPMQRCPDMKVEWEGNFWINLALERNQW
jgi:hypothetical protein